MASIDRGDVVFSEDVIDGIIQGIPTASAVMTLGRRLRDMSKAQTRMPVMSAFPSAAFVTGDTGLKATTEMAWNNVYLNAEVLACIVPIPEEVLDDSDYDIMGEVRPRVVEAMGAVIDKAVLFGTNKPSSWPSDILTGATAAGQTVDSGANLALDLYDEIMGVGGVISFPEEDGYMVNGHVGALSLRAKLRGLRTSDGLPIFTQSVQDTTRYALDGNPIEFPRNGFTAASALLFSGDWTQLVWSMRTDMRFKVLTEASLQDQAGNVIFNLPQQDMIALRCTMRLAFALPNPINLVNQNASTRYPFGVLLP